MSRTDAHPPQDWYRLPVGDEMAIRTRERYQMASRRVRNSSLAVNQSSGDQAPSILKMLTVIACHDDHSVVLVVFDKLRELVRNVVMGRSVELDFIFLVIL